MGLINKPRIANTMYAVLVAMLGSAAVDLTLSLNFCVESVVESIQGINRVGFNF